MREQPAPQEEMGESHRFGRATELDQSYVDDQVRESLDAWEKLDWREQLEAEVYQKSLPLEPEAEQIFASIRNYFIDDLDQLARHDKGTLLHSLRVTRNAMALRWDSRREHINGEASPTLDFWDDLRMIALAGLTHDIGKTQIPGAVLRSPDELSEEQWQKMQNHPVDSWVFLEKALASTDEKTVVKKIAPILTLMHHDIQKEAYPSHNGRFGDLNTDERARFDALNEMMEIADKFDAMYIGRPYNQDQDWTPEQVMENIANDFKERAVDRRDQFLRLCLAQGGRDWVDSTNREVVA